MNVFLLPQSAIMLAGNTAISVSVVSLLAIILVRTFVRTPGRQLPRRHAILVACLGVCGAAPCLLLTGNPYSRFKPSRDGFSAQQVDERAFHIEADSIVNTTLGSMALPEGRLPKPHALDEVSSGDANASSPIALRMGERGENADSAWKRNLLIRRIGSAGVFLWVIGSCVMTLRIFRTRWAVGRLMATCRTATDSRTLSSGRVATNRLGMRCQPTVLESDAILVPVTIGFLRPRVVLPADTSDLSSDQLDAILTHEFAHLKRRDHQTNGLQAIVKMMYWWHPIIHLVVSKIEELREQICDDLATHQGTDRHEYAATLIVMAERLALGTPPAGLGMGQPTSSPLERRIERLLSPAASDVSVRVTGRTMIVVSSITVLLGVTSVFAQLPSVGKNDQPRVVSTEVATGDDAKTRNAGNPTSLEGATNAAGASPWQDRRIPGRVILEGDVVDENGNAVANVDVGNHWRAVAGDLAPAAWAITDGVGRFEIPVTATKSASILMAMDRTRSRGGIFVVPPLPEPNTTNALSAVTVSAEIELRPLVEVRGSYFTAAANRRPRAVWTSIERLPEEVVVVEQYERSPTFSFLLPPGQYLLRGSAVHFEDVYRQFEVGTNQEPIEFHDLDLKVDKLGLLEGRPAPDWSFTETIGADLEISPEDLRGKWIVLEFWGVWCGPCIQHMQQLFMFHERHAEDRDQYEIITVHQDLPGAVSDLEKKLPELLKLWDRDRFPFPIMTDTTNQMVNSYGIRGYPRTVFIDPFGRVARVNGIWGLSKILDGGDGMEPALFEEHQSDLSEPSSIRNREDESEMVNDEFVVFRGHSDTAVAAEFLDKGKTLVTASSDNTIRFWDVASRKQTNLIPCTPKGNAWSTYGGTSLLIAKQGALVGGHYYETIDGKFRHTPRLWHQDSAFERFTTIKDASRSCGKSAVSPNGNWIAAYVYDSEQDTESIHIYDVDRGRLKHQLDIHGAKQRDASSGYALRFSHDSTRLAVAGAKGTAIQVWDVEQGQKHWEASPESISGINSISFSTDDRMLTFAGWSETLEIRSVDTGRLLKSLRRPGHRAIHVAFSPEGQRLASAGAFPRPRIVIWDLPSEQPTVVLTGHPTGGQPEDLAWSPNGRRLVSVGGPMRRPGEVLLWAVPEE